MKHLLLCSLTFLCTCVRAQVYFDVDQSVKVTATVQAAPAPVITVNWIQDPRALRYDLYRRRYAEGGSWGPKVGSYPADVTQYTDRTVAPQVLYEYKIVKYVEGVEGYGYVLSGIEVPAVHEAGEVLLLLTDRTFQEVMPEIQAFRATLEADGWLTRILITPQGTPVQEIKQDITEAYANRPFSALLLLGDVPVPYAGDIKPDAHPDHRGAWSADVYYGDLDGDWTDTEVNITQAANPANHNIPGDGKWDQSFLPSEVELAVGRVDFSDLPVFPEDEFALLRQYLRKNIAYRTKEIIIEQRAAMRNTNPWLGALGQNGIRNFSPLVGPENITYDEWEAVFTGTYLWYYGAGGGSQTMAGGLGSSLVYSLQDFQAVFTAWFGSYFGDYNFTDNYMRSVLASGTTLSAVWAGAPHWHFHSMGMGFPLAHATVTTQNNDTIYTADFFPRGVHVNLLGDPTLKAQIVAPPTGLLLTEAQGYIDLRWSPASEAVDQYYVYRRPDSEGTYTLLGAVPATTRQYRDSCQQLGTTYQYLVRAAKKTTTPSGSFMNLSAGATATIQATVPYLALAAFTATLTDSVLTLTSTSENATTLQWLLPDGTTASTSGLTYVLQEGEEALIQLVAENPCSRDVTSQFIVYTATSAILQPSLRVFPNPAVDRIMIRAADPVLAASITTLAGRQVLLSSTPPQRELALDVSTLPAGIYWLKMRFQQGVVLRKIMIGGR